MRMSDFPKTVKGATREIEKVLVNPAPGCQEDWQEVKPNDWDRARYGIIFETVTPNTPVTTFRNAFKCRCCGGEFVVVNRKKY